MEAVGTRQTDATDPKRDIGSQRLGQLSPFPAGQPFAR
jgi:hypothetical protein